MESLAEALYHRDTEEVEDIVLAKGFNPNWKDEEGATCFDMIVYSIDINFHDTDFVDFCVELIAQLKKMGGKTKSALKLAKSSKFSHELAKKQQTPLSESKSEDESFDILITSVDLITLIAVYDRIIEALEA